MNKNREISVRAFKKQQSKSSLFLLVFVVMLAFVSCMLVSFFVREAYDDNKGKFLERLSVEKRATETNQHLKMELRAITQTGYVEFAAGERLGLKKPKEEEVLVLR
jgi:hypothetical protein